MQIKKTLLAAAFAMILIPATAQAQSSSINTFSPFTFYGLGDLSVQGATHLRGMGGAGTAYKSGGTINYMNPASLSAMFRKSFLFEVGIQGTNHYLKTEDKNSSFNTFNVRDLAIQFPLYEKLAMSLSLTPFSSVGYRVQQEVTDPAVLPGLLEGGGIGAIYRFSGDGDINQAKASIGWEPIKKLSIGVDMVYYFGKINRAFSTEIISDGSSSFVSTQANQSEQVSRIMWNFGAQYDLIRTDRRLFTVGATWQPSAKLNPDVSINTILATGELLSLPKGVAENFTMPTMVSVGMFYQTPKMNAGVDYTLQDWGKYNKDSEFAAGTDGLMSMNFRNTNMIKAGVDYTPNLYDPRRFLNRLTYRAGVRYSDYYMRFNDTDISDVAITLGVGIPLKILSSPYGTQSYIDLGLDLGKRGTTKNNLISENYFKISIGLRLFGNDQWFRKMQYQ